MAEARKSVSKTTRRSVWLRSQYLQGSWNYERMQNLGWCYSIIPALKELYGDDSDEMKAALKRHLEFFNTHPYVASPILGVVMSLEEEKANGAEIDDDAFQGVKVGMMGPLAGVGDPVFWGTLRPIIGALAASMAATGSIIGAILFFVLWNAIRLAFLYYTQEFGYKAGSNITKDLSGGLLQKVTTGASVLGMFIMGVLIPRWTSFNLSKIVLSHAYSQSASEAFMPSLTELVQSFNGGAITEEGIVAGNSVLQGITNGGFALAEREGELALFSITTVQSVFDQLVYGFGPLLLTFLAIYLLRKKVSPIVIIFGLFAVGIIGAFFGIF
ncbi:MAG: PTS mannose/fructose/sorbose transporter family subunit IID [Atopobiaceae bacterium]|nr:PTS mannose/fructose/sorbose transporter family subunit IID [Atopobiaceae bacterium]